MNRGLSDKLKKDFSGRVTLVQRPVVQNQSTPDPAWGHWVAGFTAAEGVSLW
jgi:hypothetical protein